MFGVLLLAGEVKTLDLSLKPEVLHFGLAVEGKFGNATGDLTIPKDTNSSKSEIASPHATFYKHLKDKTGCESATLKLDTILWRQNQTVMDITQLAEAIKKIKAIDQEPFTSAQFALQMVEGVDQVRFCGLP